MSNNSPWSSLLPLRMEDVNAAGHVGATACARLVDEACTAFLHRVGLGESRYECGVMDGLPEGVRRVMVRQTTEFLRELRYSAIPLTARVWVLHIGRTSFSLVCTINGNPEEDPAVVAESTIVLIDPVKARGWPIDGALRGALSDHMGESLPLRRLTASPDSMDEQSSM